MPTPPGHPITLEPAKRRWRTYFNNHVIADSADALILREAGLPPVVYFPRQDVAMEYFGRTSHHTRCPHKGEASYYTLTLGGEILENVAWSYEEPLEAVDPIGARIAFYPDQVEIYEIEDALVNPPPRREREATETVATAASTADREQIDDRAQIDEIVQHTDAGGGVSQREHWPPNVEPRPQNGGLR